MGICKKHSQLIFSTTSQEGIMPRLNILQLVVLAIIGISTGVALGSWAAGVPLVSLWFFVGELVLFGLVTHITKKRDARPVTRPTARPVTAAPIASEATVSRQTRIQAQAQVRATRTKVPAKAPVHKAENALWKWVKEAFGQSVEAAKPAMRGAMHEAGNAARLAGRELASEAGKAGSALAGKAKAGASSLWSKAWQWMGTFTSDLLGKLIKLATGGYGAIAMFGFLAAVTLILNYAFHFTGSPLDEDEEVWARGLSATYVILMLAFLFAGIKWGTEWLDKLGILKKIK